VDLPNPESLRRDTEAVPGYLEEYLQVPVGQDPRVEALARDITAGAGNHYDRARRIESYLRENYGHTLDVRQEPGVSPLESFLFEEREGHCEFFASAMVIMLRTLGIPARLVNGFQRGDWNDLDNYFIVRQRHAHAWVEMFFPSWGWVSFDPTPPAEAAQEGSAVFALLYNLFDAARFKWDRYVIMYSLQDQVEILLNLRDGYRRIAYSVNRVVGRALDGVKRAAGGIAMPSPAVLVVAGLAVLFLAGFSAFYWRRRAGGEGLLCCRVGFYRKMLRMLQAKGFRKPPALTGKEFAEDLPGRGGEISRRITELYYRVRFGAERETPEIRREVGTRLRELKDWKPSSG
jgi:hypothetical protein